MRYCNAGHNPPLWWEAATETVHWLRPTGPALGLMPESAFTSASVPYGAGDALILYTDGLVETRNTAGEEFGEHNVADYVRRHHRVSAEYLLEGLWKEARQFSGGHLSDDVALLVIKVVEDHFA